MRKIVVITLKLMLAIIAFIISSGQIVFQTFQHHQAINPQHGLIKLLALTVSLLSLTYLVKDIWLDVADEKIISPSAPTIATAAEIDYWHSVEREAAPASYCSYLEKYPQGQFIAIAKYRLTEDCFHIEQQAQAELAAKNADAIKAQVEAELAEKLQQAQLKATAEAEAVRLKSAVNLENQTPIPQLPSLDSNTAHPAETTVSPVLPESNPQADSDDSLF